MLIRYPQPRTKNGKEFRTTDPVSDSSFFLLSFRVREFSCCSLVHFARTGPFASHIHNVQCSSVLGPRTVPHTQVFLVPLRSSPKVQEIIVTAVVGNYTPFYGGPRHRHTLVSLFPLATDPAQRLSEQERKTNEEKHF